MPPPNDGKMIWADGVKTAVQQIVPYLDDTRNNAPQLIYFDGWDGLGASAVLRAIAEQPPPSVREKFNKIIHIDCSIWKSRRAMQRVIVDELKLTQQLAADFDRQDVEDDFSGIDQGSRAEIRDVARVIARYLAQYRCLVVFHNGSNDTIDLTIYGIPQPEFFGTKALWTFRGWLRLGRQIDIRTNQSHLSLHAYDDNSNSNWDAYLAEEAREIALYTHKLGLSVTPKVATECCLYLLSLNKQGKKIMDYNWATHASSYWVCDGIIEGGHDNQTWEIAHALQQHIRLEDYSSDTMKKLDLSSKQWISITQSYFEEVPPETTTLFFAPDDKPRPRLVSYSLPSDKFHRAEQLRVLKLYRCTFSFSSPPFYCCLSLRFLGLDRCTDELKQGGQKEEKTCEPAVKIFQRLWVLDVCHTDWPLAFYPETEEQVVATDIREVHITNGRIWQSCNLIAWRRLPNLHRLRIVEPTTPWETETRDEFMDMVNLELLDLTGNNTIQVLPCLSGATGLKTLVIDGCVELEHVRPQQLPPSLESFSFKTLGTYENHNKAAKISYISLAGCARLAEFILCGAFPKLEELDLSCTSVKMLDLRVVQVKNLQRLLLMRCAQLRSISWPKHKMSEVRLMCIDTRAGEGEVANRKTWSRDCYQKDEVNLYRRVSVAVADMRFLQSLEFLGTGKYRWAWETIQYDKCNLCLSSTTTISDDDNGSGCSNEKMGTHHSTGKLASASPLPKSLAYHDINITEEISAKIDVSSSSSSSNSSQFLPLDLHMEIGEGISDVTDKSSTRARDVICDVMNNVQSLHVHDSSSITIVAPEHIFIDPFDDPGPIMIGLQWCRVERCTKLDTVFATNYRNECFSRLEIFWAAHLLMAHSIWRRPRDPRSLYKSSFSRLRAIHLHFCPRLRYVLPMASNNTLSEVLETLHIHCCGDLRQVFLVEQEFLEKIGASSDEKGMLRFPNLKSMYLYELPNLQQICEAKMFAPSLKTIYIRGCWGLRRLPATNNCYRQYPVALDCEKDWWDKLEWDRMQSDYHNPTLFEPCHSRYYKRRHLRGTVLR